jgi:hypothetical protein
LTRTTKILKIESVDQIPTIDSIKAIPREVSLKLVFGETIQKQREIIGGNLKNELEGFQVSIHMTEPQINISKLITDLEIEENQDFFEKCAKDYRHLGKKLIFELADKLNVRINPEFPLETFNEFKGNKKETGKLDSWKYYIHGFHCGFENIMTGQLIEVSLVFGLEFGDIDPFFFSQFIKSTPKYRPLPIDIFEDYADGKKINEKMISLGKFERINSNIENHYGVVVTDRSKVEINEFKKQPENKIFKFIKFLRLKK